jgi:hypothetical protein
MSYNIVTAARGVFGKVVVQENPKDLVTDFTGGIELGGATVRVKKINLVAGTHGTGAEVDTGWDLPDTSIVIDAFLNVTTAEATGTTKTLDVGTLATETDGDANGFLAGASLAAAALVGGIGTAATQTYGALLLDIPSTIATDGSMKVNYAVDSGTARSVSVTAGSSDCADFVADLYILYLVIE